MLSLPGDVLALLARRRLCAFSLYLSQTDHEHTTDRFADISAVMETPDVPDNQVRDAAAALLVVGVAAAAAAAGLHAQVVPVVAAVVVVAGLHAEVVAALAAVVAVAAEPVLLLLLLLLLGQLVQLLQLLLFMLQLGCRRS